MAWTVMVRARGMPPGTAFLQPQVLVTGLIALVSFWSAFRIGRAGKAIQVVMAFIVTLLSAATMDSRELSSLVYFGLLVALAYAYGYLQRRLWAKLFLFTIPLLVTIGIRLWSLHPGVPAVVVQWIAGAIFVLSLYAAVIAAVHSWFLSKEADLQGRVQRRTADLRVALDRNRTLLQEVQHRTQNNLQMISSLLSLEQSDPDLESKSAGQVLETARRRVQAMATAHQLLHHSDKTSEVNIAQFMQELTNEFIRSGEVSDIKIDAPIAQELEVQMEFAAPLGLVVSELIANSAEHACSGERYCTVWLSIHREDGSLAITIEDQGSEFPERISLDRPESTGLQIVTSLVAQIQGTIDLQKKPNTKWIITAPLPG